MGRLVPCMTPCVELYVFVVVQLFWFGYLFSNSVAGFESFLIDLCGFSQSVHAVKQNSLRSCFEVTGVLLDSYSPHTGHNGVGAVKVNPKERLLSLYRLTVYACFWPPYSGYCLGQNFIHDPVRSLYFSFANIYPSLSSLPLAHITHSTVIS